MILQKGNFKINFLFCNEAFLEGYSRNYLKLLLYEMVLVEANKITKLKTKFNYGIYFLGFRKMCHKT